MAILLELIRQLIKKPATSNYPVEREEPPSGLRGKPIIDDQKCIRCGLCEKNCPGLAIQIGKPRTDEPSRIYLDKCIFCGLCEEICPVQAVTMTPIYELATSDLAELAKTQSPHQSGSEKKKPAHPASR
jgi:formate hydrogenlyase subunit 6/NADH:ubiquinone oxidoreductase subunit I